MEKIIERVQKLLALAGNNSNEHEAAAAIEKAHAILAEHNLSMQQVNQHTATTGNAEDDERGALNTETNFSEKQYRWIWSAVAEAHFCKMYWCRPNPRKRETTYTVIGRKVNAIVAAQLATYLCVTVRRLANEAAKKTGRSDHAFKNAFVAGAAARLHARISAMKFGDTQQQNALVLWTGDEQEKNAAFAADFFKAKGSEIVPAKKQKQTTYDRQGSRMGDEAGNSISLAQQVGSTATEAKRLGNA